MVVHEPVVKSWGAAGKAYGCEQNEGHGRHDGCEDADESQQKEKHRKTDHRITSAARLNQSHLMTVIDLFPLFLAQSKDP